jgi:hypothetical protein
MEGVGALLPNLTALHNLVPTSHGVDDHLGFNAAYSCA